MNTLTKQDLKGIVRLDRLVYTDRVKLGLLEKWFEINPQIWRYVRVEKRIVGYLELMPITEQTFNEIKVCQNLDFQKKLLPLEYVKQEKRIGFYFYIPSLVAIANNRQKFDKGKIVSGIFEDSVEFLKQLLIAKNIYIKKVVAVPVTTRGEYYCKKYGFKKIKTLADKLSNGFIPKVYVLDLASLDEDKILNPCIKDLVIAYKDVL